MRQLVIQWKLVLSYAPISNDKSPRMIGTLKKSVALIVTANALSWYEGLLRTIFGYKRRKGFSVFSSFVTLCSHLQIVTSIESYALCYTENESIRIAENLAVSIVRVSRVFR